MGRAPRSGAESGGAVGDNALPRAARGRGWGWGLISGPGRIIALVLLLLASLPAAAIRARVEVWFDTDGNGRRDAGEAGAPEVTVSDGDRLYRTAADGAARVEIVAENGHGRRLFVIRPGGHRLTTPWHVYLAPTDDEQPVAFGLAPEPEPVGLRFAVTAEPQVTIADASAVGAELVADLLGSGESDFGVILGDLTEHGTPAELEAWSAAVAAAPRPLYALFGARDGLGVEPRSAAAFEALVGPAWFAFWRGGHLFCALVTEPGELTGVEQARQSRWLRRLMVSLPEGTPVVALCHVPPAEPELARLSQGLRLRAVFYAHWHENSVWHRDGVPMICTGPFRGSEWGAGTATLRRVEIDDQQVRAEVRRCGVRRLFAVLAPSLLQPPGGGPVPLQVITDESTADIAALAALREGKAPLPLARLDRCNWRLEAPFETGETVTLQVTCRDRTTWEQRLTVPAPAAAAVDPAGAPPRPPLRRAWLAPTGVARRENSSPVVADGRVFVALPDEDLPARPGIVAFDAVTGRELWRAETVGSVRGEPVVVGGAVYVMDHLHHAYAFAAADGRPRWHRELTPEQPARHRSSRTGLGWSAGRLLAQLAGGPLMVLDPSTGETLGKATIGGAQFSRPVATASQILVPAASGLISLEPTTLAERWRTHRALGFARHGPASVGNGLVYLLGPDLYAVDAGSGAVRWSKPLAFRGLALGGVVVRDGVVYTPGPRPAAYHAVTGAPHWQVQPLAAYAAATPAIAGEHLWTVDDEGILLAYRLADGGEAWRASVGVPLKSSPVVAGGALYLLDGYGNLHAYVGAGP